MHIFINVPINIVLGSNENSLYIPFMQSLSIMHVVVVGYDANRHKSFSLHGVRSPHEAEHYQNLTLRSAVATQIDGDSVLYFYSNRSCNFMRLYNRLNPVDFTRSLLRHQSQLTQGL